MAIAIDMKKEQAACLMRPCRRYGFFAKILFTGMDWIHGKKLTLPKVRLLELLARIPYQAWEIRHYHRLNCKFNDTSEIDHAKDIISWGREAQDNEFWHLEVINEKISQEGVKLNWFRDRFLPPIAAFKYNLFCRFLAVVHMNSAFFLNADFEDHAEHEYFRFVQDHPELEKQPVKAKVVLQYGNFKSWADVFRRIALDERDHMNNSLKKCGLEAEIVKYVHEKKAVKKRK